MEALSWGQVNAYETVDGLQGLLTNSLGSRRTYITEITNNLGQLILRKPHELFDIVLVMKEFVEAVEIRLFQVVKKSMEHGPRAFWQS